MNNLKLCPFCGGVAELKAPGYEHYSPCWVKCTRCGAEGPTKSSELEAEKGWNERVQDGVEHAMTVNGWISAKDKLPEKNGDYLAYTRDGIVWPYFFTASSGVWEDTLGYSTDTVTHWMPLPEAPKEE